MSQHQFKQLVAALHLVLPGVPVLTPGHKDYLANTTTWNLYTQYTPAAVVQPTTAGEVASAIQAADSVDWPQIAIRSGGHSFEGSSLGGKNGNALVIDMIRLNSITCDPDNHTVTAGGGALLGAVYEAAWRHGEMVPMGSCVSVGLGGQLQAGGYGFYTRAYGPMVDRILEMEVVTADGEIRTVNDSENGELFYALRGAGTGSYGVITRVVLRSNTAPKGCAVFSYSWPLKGTDIATTLSKIQDAALVADQGFSPMIVFWQGILEVAGSILAEDEETVNAIATQFSAATNPAKASLKHVSFRDSVTELALVQTSAPWYHDMTKVTREGHEHVRFMKIKAGFMAGRLTPEFIARWAQYVVDMPDAGVRVQILGLDTEPPEHDTTSVKVRGTPWLMGMSVWTPADLFGGVQGSIKAAYDRLPWMEGAYNLFYPETVGGYIGDDDLEEGMFCRDMYESYWGEHMPRLVEVKNRYDPENRFNHRLSIPVRLDTPQL